MKPTVARSEQFATAITPAAVATTTEPLVACATESDGAMNGRAEFVLPACPEPHADPDMYRRHIAVALRAAIATQEAQLLFPKRQVFATYFDLEPASASALRRELIATGHLVQFHGDYLTTHPSANHANTVQVS